MSGPRLRNTSQLVWEAPLRSAPERPPTPGISRSITNWGIGALPGFDARAIAHLLGNASRPGMPADPFGHGHRAWLLPEIDRDPAGASQRIPVELEPSRSAAARH